MYFKDDDRYFKHPLPVQIRLTHVRVECAIILISMACQRSLILDCDVQDALLAGGEVNPGNGSLGIQLQNAKLKQGKHPFFCFLSFQFPLIVQFLLVQGELIAE